MKNENTTKTAQTTSSKTEPKKAESNSNICWVKETKLVDGRPYLIQHGKTVYPVVYNANIQHFVGYGYNERVKPDFILEYEPHNV